MTIVRSTRIAGLLFVVCAGAAHASPGFEVTRSPIDMDIESQPVEKAINAWAKETGYQVLMPIGQGLASPVSPAIKGLYTPEGALRILLASTDFNYRLVNARTVAIRTQGEDTEQRQSSAGRSSVADSKKATSDDKLEEVVVTATKRSERLQDVSASITAISKGDIERRGLSGMDDYMRSVPSVSRMETGAGRTNPIVIRGISTNPEGDKAPVGTYFGQVPLTSSIATGDYYGSPDIALVDIEQIEVLKGPQGTLYGSGALSGIVRNQPAAPNLKDFLGRVSMGSSQTAKFGGSNYLVNGMLNMPLVQDKLAVRLVGYRYSDSGYIKNVAATGDSGLPTFVGIDRGFGAPIINQDDVGQTDRTGGRVAVLWQPVDPFKATYTFMRQVTEQNGVPEVHLGLGGYKQGYVETGATASRSLGQDAALTIHNLVLDYQLQGAQILSSSSYIQFKPRFARDVSLGFNAPVDQISSGRFRELAQEVRLTSSLQGPLQFLVGGFYENSKHKDIGNGHWTGDPDLYPYANGRDALPLFYSGRGDVAVEQKSFFGELSYELLSGLKATVGGRRFSYDFSQIVFSSFMPAFDLSSPVAETGRLNSSESGNVYKAALSYKPSEGSLVYGQWAQGFRLGNPAQPVTPGDPVCDSDGDGAIEFDVNGVAVRGQDQVESDRTDNFELGGKFSLLNGRAAINAAIYQINWKNLPIVAGNDTSTCFASFNASTARSRGVEVESQLRLLPGLQAGLGVSYTKAELTSDLLPIGSKGNRLPGSPRFLANTSLNYDFPLRGYDAYARADMSYVSKFYNNLQQAGAAAGGYYQLNIRSGIKLDAVNVDLYVNNLTGADNLTWVYATLTADNRGYRLRPRTMGVQLTWSF